MPNSLELNVSPALLHTFAKKDETSHRSMQTSSISAAQSHP